MSFTPWHIVVDTGRRRVTVYKRGHTVRVFKAVVGKPSTPTPTGKFFVEESVELGRGDVGAPFALALSARSNVFQEFEGGPGQIALHGLMNVGGRAGHGRLTRLRPARQRRHALAGRPRRPRRARDHHRLTVRASPRYGNTESQLTVV